MIRWLTVVAASLSWLFAFHHYVAEAPLRQWAMIGVALLAAVIGFPPETAAKGRPTRFLLLALLLPTAVVTSLAASGYRPPLLLFGAGCLLTALSSSATWCSPLRRVGWAALILGIVLIVQSPTFWLYTAWAARNPEVPFLGPVIYHLLSWLGSDVSLSGGVVHLRTIRHVHTFPLSWGHLAAFPLVQIWIAGTIMTWWGRGELPVGRRLITLCVLLLAYAPFRLLLVMCCFLTAMLFEPHGSERVWVEFFWVPWITLASFLPLIPIAARLVPLYAGQTEAASTSPAAPQWRPAAAIASAALACLGMVVGARLPDPGRENAGRLLIDEAHSRWERSDTVYDTDWYGSESGYNYYCMARYLEHFYKLDTHLEGPLTPAQLAGYDVLLLKTPTARYQEAEIDAIEAFVRDGGGLFVFGEHTDVFGTSTFANPVLRRLGLALHTDAVFDLDRKFEQVFIRPRWGAHPILNDVPFFRFAVTCSIATDTWSARPVVRGTGLWALPIEYSSGNFYPQVLDHTYARFGAFDQMMSATAGRGRVVVFGDSTVYSNFLAFHPGKPELLLGSTQWLNRSNRFRWVNLLGYVLFTGGLVSMLWNVRRLQPALSWTPALAIVAATAGWVGLWACTALGNSWYPTPVAHTPVKEVVFDLEYGTCELPIFSFTQKQAESYEIFHQWVLRLGYYPTVTFDLDRALAESAPIIIVKPNRSFTREARAEIRRFLEAGGSLLVLDAWANTDSTANELLGEYGLSFESASSRGSAIVEPESGARICGVRQARPVSGGTVLLATDRGEPVVASTAVGQGHLVAAGLADRFVDTKMGFTSRSVPNREMRAVYELEFALLRGLVEGDPARHARELGATYAE